MLNSPKESDGMQRLDKKSVHKKEREAAEKLFGIFLILSITSLFKLQICFLIKLWQEINLESMPH